MNVITDYWFTIEPYVYVNISDKHALLYNTLDGVVIESTEIEVIELLKEVLQQENCGVFLLKNKRYTQGCVNEFIRELREKYMGDIIDVSLSKGKPVQVLPYVNYPTNSDKNYNFLKIENLLQTLFEVTLHLDRTVNVVKLIAFIQSLPNGLTFNIVGNWRDIPNEYNLFTLLNQYSSPKNIMCSYMDIVVLEANFRNEFSYKVSVHFPVNMAQWKQSIKLLLKQNLPVEYIFRVTSSDDCQQVDYLLEQYQIEKYDIKPVYTGENIIFFEENVFLTKEDILSTSMSIRDFFVKKSINTHDFGKINIMPNGDVYANKSNPILGSIYTHDIYDILQNEMEYGKSWLRTRSKAPCNTCVYQYLCPSPSDYEMAIGRPNLCRVNSLKNESF